MGARGVGATEDRYVDTSTADSEAMLVQVEQGFLLKMGMNGQRNQYGRHICGRHR
jgi:hypothetical protein